MSKVLKLFASAALVAGALALAPGSAQAAHWHHGWHHGWGWGPGFGLGLGLGAAVGYPYYGGPYYAEPACGWTPIRVRRHGHWVVRRAWRCW